MFIEERHQQILKTLNDTGRSRKGSRAIRQVGD